MEPNSPLLLVMLLLGTAGLLVAFARYHHLAVRTACGTLATALAVTGGVFVVNDYYGYYQSWSQLSADLSGSYATPAATPTADRTIAWVGNGWVQSIDLPGPRSAINRTGLDTCHPSISRPVTPTHSSPRSNCYTARLAARHRGWSTCTSPPS
jgi:hypothetical protein